MPTLGDGAGFPQLRGRVLARQRPADGRCPVSAPDLAADAAELREIIAGLRLEAADLADKLSQMARSAASVNAFMNVVIAARHEGYREGLAAADTHQATARAQQRRAEFRAVPGRPAGRRDKGARGGGAQ